MQPRFFKSSAAGRPGDLKKFLPVSVNFSLEALYPAMCMIERRHILPLLGYALFERLAGFCDSGVPSSDTHKAVLQEALDLVRLAVARLSYCSAYDELSVRLDDSGASSQADKDRRLFKYQEDNLKRGLFDDGYNALDSALALFASNSEAFPEYANSPWMKSVSMGLVRSASEFDDVVSIGGSILVFSRMSRWMRIVEDLHLSHRIGGDTLADFVAHRYDTSAAYVSVVGDLVRYVVFKSMSLGAADLKCDPTSRGVLYREFHAYNDGETWMQLPAGELQRKCAVYDGYAESYLGRAISEMNVNPEDYPCYARFAGIGNPTRNRLVRDNDNKKTVVL